MPRRSNTKLGHPLAESRHDHGFTFIEVLVAVVLMGTGVIAILSAVQATTIATTTERDHARALEWLNSASEILINDTTWQDCTVPASVATDTYETTLRSVVTIRPAGWSADQLSIPVDVSYGQIGGDYAATCVAPIERQLVTLRVTDTEDEIVESLQVVVIP